MSQTPDALSAMQDYVRQLKRHTSKRRALHIKLSSLERHMHEPYYRREMASALSPLVTKKGARLFALPNADCVLITHDATLDDLAPVVRDAQRRLRDSRILAQLDPVIGVSDSFTEWFDLEEDYSDFATYIEHLAEKLLAGAPQASPAQKAGMSKKAAKRKPPEKPAEEPVRNLDASVLASMMRKLPLANVASALRDQTVVAIVGNAKPVPVLVHKFIDAPRLIKKLSGVDVQVKDRWLKGYLSEEIALKMLELGPDLKNKGSIASSIRLTCSAVLSDIFDAFDGMLTKDDRGAVILEFSLIDILANPRSYAEAYSKIEPRGYKISLADVEPESLLWLDYAKLHAAFIKLHTPCSGTGVWLTHELEQDIIARISKIGRARVILDGCNTPLDMELGQQLGITLFQGDYLG